MDADKIQYLRQDSSNAGGIGNMPQMDNINQQAMAGIPITNQPTTFRPVGPRSMEMTCPGCRCRIKTRIRHRSTAKTHIACLLLTGLCCCWLPYCMDTCRNTNHFCPMCETFLGTYVS